MIESGKSQFLLKKSYEISYALWRISANIKERSFADTIAEKAITFIGFAANGDYAAISAMISGLKYLIHFGSDIGIISQPNRGILFKEIGNLESAIADLPVSIEFDQSSGHGNDIDISDIFSSEVIEKDTEVEEKDYSESQNPGNGKSEIRQSAILEKIKEIGNCRLGDLQAVLPDVSERTIRYDLEALVERKLIERVGVAGRGIYYKIPDHISG